MPPEPPDRWTLFIPGYFPPSMNTTHHAHWQWVRKHKKRAIENLHIYCLQAGGVPQFTGHAVVTITRLWGKRQRARDKVNLYGSAKPLEDAMRKEKASRNQSGRTRQGGLGIIEDDTPALLDLTVVQFKHGSPKALELLAAAGIDTARMDFDAESTLIVVEGVRAA